MSAAHFGNNLCGSHAVPRVGPRMPTQPPRTALSPVGTAEGPAALYCWIEHVSRTGSLPSARRTLGHASPPQDPVLRGPARWAPVTRPRRDRPRPRDRGEDERPLNLRQWAQAIAVVALLVLSVGAWLVVADANTWVGIAVVAVGVGAIGWWYARRRIRYSAEEDGE